MGQVCADRVRETSTTTGTGTLSLLGAVTGFRTFVAAAGTAAKVFYAIVNRAAPSEWEVGIGTVTDASTDTLSRDKIITSSNSNNAVSFTAGTKDVRLVLPAVFAARQLPNKGNVRVATTASGTLATSFENGDTVDGVVLATGDRILIKNQATASQNGIYDVQASGAPVRSADMFTGDAAAGAMVYVTNGTANGGKTFRCTSAPGSDTVNTSSLTFTDQTGISDHGGLSGLSDDDHVIYTKADGTRAFTAVVSGVTPTSAAHLATKAYVDSVAAGLKWKTPVRVATTANGTLATAYENGDTVDGVVLATSDRILLKDQTSGVENGIYVVNASGAPTRASDMAAASSAAGAVCYVTAGTANANKAFVCNNTSGSDVVGTDALVFVLFNSSGGVTDHGALSGLGDDDHSIYLLTDGTRAMTGELAIGAYSILSTEQGSNPSTPASGKWKVFTKADGLYYMDDAGTVTGPLAGAGGLPVVDTTEIVYDPVDTSKKMRIDVGAVNTATTRILTMGDRNVDLASGGTFAELSHTHAASAIVSGTLVHERGGLEADVSAYDGLIKITGGATTNIKCAFAQSAAPTVNDDTGDSYVIGSLWIDTTNDKVYMAVDVTAAAAVWKELSPAAGGSIDDLSDVTITSAAQGDILYHNGTAFVNLAAGTSGRFLKTQGAGANPTWSAAVVGPGSATDNALARFDATTGSLIQNSGLTVDDSNKITLAAATSPITSDTDGATVTMDMGASNKHTVTLGGNRTIAFSNVTSGQCFLVRLVQDGTGSRTVTWPSGVRWASGTAPTLTTTANKGDWFGFMYDGTIYMGVVFGQNYTMS